MKSGSPDVTHNLIQAFKYVAYRNHSYHFKLSSEKSFQNHS
jgi:hypothetical protein